jgi:hypothetical protein
VAGTTFDELHHNIAKMTKHISFSGFVNSSLEIMRRAQRIAYFIFSYARSPHQANLAAQIDPSCQDLDP